LHAKTVNQSKKFKGSCTDVTSLFGRDRCSNGRRIQSSNL